MHPAPFNGSWCSHMHVCMSNVHLLVSLHLILTQVLIEVVVEGEEAEGEVAGEEDVVEAEEEEEGEGDEEAEVAITIIAN